MSIFSISCKSQESGKYESISAVEFQKRLFSEPKSLVIDVRSAEEFASGHLKNAININWNSENFNEEIKKFDKTKPIFVNCQAGGRSKKAAERLVSLGFERIIELDGGINAWTKNNLLLTK